MAEGKTVTRRAWLYVGGDPPVRAEGPPTALFYACRDRSPSKRIDALFDHRPAKGSRPGAKGARRFWPIWKI